MPIDKETVNKSSPDAQAVTEFHRYSDADTRSEAQHHTLGLTHNQGSWGDHNHRDGNGIPILDGVTLSGNVTTNTASVLKQVTDALGLLGASVSGITGP